MSDIKASEVTFDPSTTPLELSSSLTDIESALLPFLSKEWAGQLESLSHLERAKLDVMMAYTIVDLIWVYLKMKGVDPAKHEVTHELERVRGYYAKIRKIENPEEGARKYKIDVPAAGRFILNGIPVKQRIGNSGEELESLPQTSAAGAAQAGRDRAVREQEEASIERMGKSGRMRFVAQEAERIVPGTEGEMSQDEEMAADEELGGLDEDEGDEGEEEEPLGGVQAVEIIEVDDDDGDDDDDDDESDFEMLDGPPESGTRTPAEQAADLFGEIDEGLAKAKRKRAEEF